MSRWLTILPSFRPPWPRKKAQRYVPPHDSIVMLHASVVLCVGWELLTFVVVVVVVVCLWLVSVFVMFLIYLLY